MLIPLTILAWLSLVALGCLWCRAAAHADMRAPAGSFEHPRVVQRRRAGERR